MPKFKIYIPTSWEQGRHALWPRFKLRAEKKYPGIKKGARSRLIRDLIEREMENPVQRLSALLKKHGKGKD